MNLQELAAPFAATEISWRVGKKTADGKKGQALPYIEARNVQNRLDAVVGLGGWRNSFTEVTTGNKLAVVRCSIGVHVNGLWVDKEDASQVREIGNDDNAEMVVKGAYSDALKRAAVMWGIGRYLKGYEAPWVDLDEQGRMKRIPALPAEFLPAGAAASTPATKTTTTRPAPTPAPTPAVKAEAAAPAPAAEASPPPAPAPAPEPAPAPAPAPAPVAAAPAEAPASTDVKPYTEAELAALPTKAAGYVKSITTHLEKRTSLPNLRAYINGPKMLEALPEAVRIRMTALVDKAIGEQETAQA